LEKLKTSLNFLLKMEQQMKKLSAIFLIGGLLFGLSACDSDSGEKNEPNEHVWQGQVESLDKAKQVESMVMDSADRQRQALDNAEQGEAQ